MKRIIVYTEYWDETLKELNAEVRPSSTNGDHHFYSEDGDIVECHIRGADELIKQIPNYKMHFFCTVDPVNYTPYASDSK